MKLKKVLAISQYIAERYYPNKDTACISITDPENIAKLKDGWSDLLRIEFHDIDTQIEDLSLFSEEQAVEIINFVQKLERDNNTKYLIIHCLAGVSRSVAVALFIHENFIRNEIDLRGTEAHNKHVRRTLKNVWFAKTGEFKQDSTEGGIYPRNTHSGSKSKITI